MGVIKNKFGKFSELVFYITTTGLIAEPLVKRSADEDSATRGAIVGDNNNRLNGMAPKGATLYYKNYLHRNPKQLVACCTDKSYVAMLLRLSELTEKKKLFG